MTHRERYGATIKAMRRAGLSLSAIARQLGLSLSVVQDIDHNKQTKRGGDPRLRSERRAPRHRCKRCRRPAVDRLRREWLCERCLNPDVHETVTDHSRMPSAAAEALMCADAPPTLTTRERRRLGV